MPEAVTKPVWVWTAGAVEPVRCGSFTWREGLGAFTYDRDFMASDGATPLDPVNLPFTRALRPHPCVGRRSGNIVSRRPQVGMCSSTKPLAGAARGNPRIQPRILTLPN